MISLKTFCLLALLVAAASAVPKHKNKQGNASSGNLKPSEWLSASELQSAPSVEDVTLQELENMSVEEGEKLIQKLYHLSQINHKLQPSFVPSPSNIPVTIFRNNGQAINTDLSQLVEAVKGLPNFGEQEVTIFITGLPQNHPAVAKANRKLVQAYMQRYNGQIQSVGNNDYDYGQGQGDASTSIENGSWKNGKNNGNLIIINLGATITSFQRFVLLDVEQTGKMIGNELVQLTLQTSIRPDCIHIVAHGIGAPVSGEAGRQFQRRTDKKLRRITALDPSKIFAKHPSVLTGLARGDAEFVDAIHTSTNGIGTRQRVGDIDFYVNGPASTVPGAKNVIEASMRAVRYFAESVRPGNERNFPAVAANSLQQYRNNNGNCKRAFMGIDTEYDLEGDYVLEVNAQSPFGKQNLPQKQNTYHGGHQQWQAKNTNRGYNYEQ